MIINVFKNLNFYKNLEKYNQDILDVCKNWNFNTEEIPVNLEKKIVSRWFDPNFLKNLFTLKSFPEKSKLYKENRFNLILTVENYSVLFLINLLYSNRKSILIEDVCGGMGRLLFYLSKCRFNNFSIIDNFCQVSQSMFEELMEKGKIKYILNDYKSQPIISNQAGATPAWIKNISSNIELFCYTKHNKGYHKNLMQKQVNKHNLVYLCTDSDDLNNFYCKESKYNEFKEQLKPYEVINE